MEIPLNQYIEKKTHYPEEYYKKGNHIDRTAHYAMRLATEASEVADYAMRIKYEGYEEDIGHLNEEIGDMMHVLTELMMENGLDFEDILDKNLEKCKARYPNGYTPEASKKRNKLKEAFIFKEI